LVLDGEVDMSIARFSGRLALAIVVLCAPAVEGAPKNSIPQCDVGWTPINAGACFMLETVEDDPNPVNPAIRNISSVSGRVRFAKAYKKVDFAVTIWKLNPGYCEDAEEKAGTCENIYTKISEGEAWCRRRLPEHVDSYDGVKANDQRIWSVEFPKPIYDLDKVLGEVQEPPAKK